MSDGAKRFMDNAVSLARSAPDELGTVVKITHMHFDNDGNTTSIGRLFRMSDGSLVHRVTDFPPRTADADSAKLEVGK